MSPVQVSADAAGHRLALADGSASLRLVPRLGLVLPRYHFHIGRVVHAAQELGLFRVQTTLLLGNDHTGSAELTDMQVAPGVGPSATFDALGRLIAAAQALMTDRPGEFGDALVAELPGRLDGQGRSPFWGALGARFFPGDVAAAQARLGPAWRSHLAALLPRQTIYLSFLGAAAQAHLLQVGASDEPALAALRAAGFQPPAHARIDDGGPVLAWRPGR